MRRVLFLLFLLCLMAVTVVAQDPVQVDPQHYKVEFENDQMRVVRITFGPNEKSVMHEHPNGGCVIQITDEHTRHTDPAGKATITRGTAGTFACDNRGGTYRHLPESLSNQRLELLLVEMKNKPAVTPTRSRRRGRRG